MDPTLAQLLIAALTLFGAHRLIEHRIKTLEANDEKQSALVGQIPVLVARLETALKSLEDAVRASSRVPLIEQKIDSIASEIKSLRDSRHHVSEVVSDLQARVLAISKGVK